MTISSVDFLKSAEIAASGSSEIDWRNGISRAYYSAYHAALGFIDQRFADPEEHLHFGAHERLANRYKTWKDNHKGKSISYVLTHMKRQRHLADYNISDSLKQVDAETQIASTKKLMDTLLSIEQSESSEQA